MYPETPCLISSLIVGVGVIVFLKCYALRAWNLRTLWHTYSPRALVFLLLHCVNEYCNKTVLLTTSQLNRMHHIASTLHYHSRVHLTLHSCLQSAFHNITRVMDCVGCEKCKMHGKLNILGIASAMKVSLPGPVSNPLSEAISFASFTLNCKSCHCCCPFCCCCALLGSGSCNHGRGHQHHSARIGLG